MNPAALVAFTFHSTFGGRTYTDVSCSDAQPMTPSIDTDVARTTIYFDGRPNDGGYARVGLSTYSVSAPGLNSGPSRTLALEGTLDFEYQTQGVLNVPVTDDGGCSPLPTVAIQSTHRGVGFQPVASTIAASLTADIASGTLSLCTSVGTFPANAAFTGFSAHNLSVTGLIGAEGTINLVPDVGAFINPGQSTFRMCLPDQRQVPGGDAGVCCSGTSSADSGVLRCGS